VTGGLHGKNRLMGNSLLDITVFGRRSAESVLRNIPERGAVTLTHLKRFQAEREKMGGSHKTVSPKFFPDASKMKLKPASVEKKQEEKSSSNNFEPPNPFNF
jgi:aspartate oxidase